jgi:hypothetical protein
VPFHDCTSGLVAPDAVTVPLAKQLDAVTHETLCKSVNVAPLGLGLAAMVHAVPFHRSTSFR